MITCLKLHWVQAAHNCIRKWALDILSGGHKSAGILPNRAPHHRRFTDPKAKLGGKPSKLCLNMNRNKQGSTVKLAKIKDYGSYIRGRWLLRHAGAALELVVFTSTLRVNAPVCADPLVEGAGACRFFFSSAVDKISHHKVLIDGEALDKESVRYTTSVALPRFWFCEGLLNFYERVTHADRDFQHEIAALQARIVVEAKQAAAPTSPPASPTEAENTAGSKTCPFKMFYKDIRRHLWLNP